MMDRPIHLAELFICNRDDHTASSVTVPVWITQSTLDGMIELMKFMEGLRLGRDGGDIPGEFDFIMFYRTIREAIYKADNAAMAEAKRIADIPEGEPTDYNPAYVGNGTDRDRFGRRILTVEERKQRWDKETGGC